MLEVHKTNILALHHSKAVFFSLCSFVILGRVRFCFKPYQVPLEDCVT